MKHPSFNLSLTHRETRDGLIYMVLSFTVLPWLLREGNGLLAQPLSAGKLNFIYYCVNFLAMAGICRHFLKASAAAALRDPFRVVWYAILGYLGSQALGEILSVLTLAVYPTFSNINDQSVIRMLREDTRLIVLGTVVLVPLAEELFFRGLIFRNVYAKSQVGAYLLSMALFSLIHVAGYIGAFSWDHLLLCFLQYLPAGFCLGWCYCQTGTVITPIAMHALTNAMSVYELMR